MSKVSEILQTPNDGATNIRRHDLQVVWKAPDALKVRERNPRTHSAKQLQQIAASIRQFGFVNPVLVDQEGRIVAGHGRVRAAVLLGLTEVPTLCVAGLSDAELRALVIADNRLAENAGWDQDLLALEFGELAALDLDFNVEVTGFDTSHIDLLVGSEEQPSADPEADNVFEPTNEPVVSQLGDLWLMGHHRLICGDARDPATYERLLEGEKAQLVFADPPYNVPIDGNVCGKGRIHHREFQMASGEMSAEEFTAFLATVLKNLARFSDDGSIHFICIDWRHIGELLDAGEKAYSELKNLVVWNKDNAGMGSFYRSKHELIFAFKSGTASHINNFGLGGTGRYRTNVWDYPGISSLQPSRMKDLAMHPTVKPVALVADAIRDCSQRNRIVLDPCVGSGTAVIAAEKTGRCAYGIEIDPAYVDAAIRRFQEYTGKEAILAATGQTYAATLAAREASLSAPPTSPSTPPIESRAPVGADLPDEERRDTDAYTEVVQ
jgi:DNA modification methylase